MFLLSCPSGPPWKAAGLTLICLVPAQHAKPSVQQLKVTLSLIHALWETSCEASERNIGVQPSAYATHLCLQASHRLSLHRFLFLLNPIDMDHSCECLALWLKSKTKPFHVRHQSNMAILCQMVDDLVSMGDYSVSIQFLFSKWQVIC